MLYKILICTVSSIFLFVQNVCADNQHVFNDWIVEITDQSVETYTTSGTDTSFGIFCAGGQCFSYIRQSVSCTAGVRSTMMLNTGAQSIPLTTWCLHIGQNSFQTIDQSNVLFEILKTAQILSFATPIKDGGFAVSMFQMRGSQDAINFALKVAVKMARSKTFEPKSFAAPGLRQADEIRL